MKDGYIKVAAATPKVKVADTVYNGQLIKALMKECTDNGAKVVVFPELCITGYTCQDLFWQDKLIAALILLQQGLFRQVHMLKRLRHHG